MLIHCNICQSKTTINDNSIALDKVRCSTCGFYISYKKVSSEETQAPKSEVIDIDSDDELFSFDEEQSSGDISDLEDDFKESPTVVTIRKLIEELPSDKKDFSDESIVKPSEQTYIGRNIAINLEKKNKNIEDKERKPLQEDTNFNFAKPKTLKKRYILFFSISTLLLIGGYFIFTYLSDIFQEADVNYKIEIKKSSRNINNAKKISNINSKKSEIILTGDNIDTLGYADLKNTVNILTFQNKEQLFYPKLVWWGWYRLASTFNDQDARKKMSENLPDDLNVVDMEDLRVAAIFGWFILNNKHKKVIQLSKIFPKKIAHNSPHIQYIYSLIADKNTDKLNFLNRAVELKPSFEDAQFEQGLTLIKSKKITKGIEKLDILIKKTKNLDILINIADVFLRQHQSHKILNIVNLLPTYQKYDLVSLKRRNSFFRLLIVEKILLGEIENARKIVLFWVNKMPKSLDANFYLANISTHEKAIQVLLKLYSSVSNEEDKARILVHRIRYTLMGKNKDKVTALSNLFFVKDKNKDKDIIKHYFDLAQVMIMEHKNKTQGNLNEKEKKIAFTQSSKKISDLRLKILKKLSLYYPYSSDISYRFALKEFSQNNYSKALTYLNEAIWNGFSYLDINNILVQRVKYMIKKGDINFAYDVIKRLHKDRPNNLSYFYLCVEIALKLKFNEDALSFYEEMIERESTNLDLKLKFISLLITLEKHEYAKNLLDKLTQKKDQKSNKLIKNYDIFFLYGRLWMLRDPIKAQDYFLKAIHIKPDAESYFLLSKIADRRKRLEKSIKFLKKIYALEPDFKDINFHLGKAFFRLSKFTQSIPYFKRFLIKNPNNQEVLIMLGDVYNSEGKKKQALKYYQKSLNKENLFVETLMKISRIQLEYLEQNHQAIKNLKTIISIEPKTSEAYYMLGYVFKDLEKFSEACKFLKKYSELNKVKSEDVRADIKFLCRK